METSGLGYEEAHGIMLSVHHSITGWITVRPHSGRISAVITS